MSAAATLANLVTDGELVTMLPGVFRSAQWPFGRDQIMAAVCARNPAALIGFTTAGQEWGLRRMADPEVHASFPTVGRRRWTASSCTAVVTSIRSTSFSGRMASA